MSPDCTPEESEAVNRINKTKDHYEILAVGRTATLEEIRNAYKKQARLVHPDKNKNPGATKAFQAIGQALTILTDPERRNYYDETGLDEPPSSTPRTYTFYFREEDAEEVFRTFFKNENLYEGDALFELFQRTRREQTEQNVPKKRKKRKQTQMPQEERREEPKKPEEVKYSFFENRSNVIIVILIIGAILLFGFYLWFGPSELLYSLERNSSFRHARRTLNQEIQYFVKNGDYLRKFKGSRNDFENIVEEDFLSDMKKSCYQQIDKRDSMLWKARNFADRQLFKAAHNFEMSPCDRLDRYGVVI